MQCRDNDDKCIENSYSTLLSGIPWNIPRVTCILTKINTSDKWDILWYITRDRSIIILYHAVENTLAVHDGKVGCNTVECTTTYVNLF